jgi:hypothetical protein
MNTQPGSNQTPTVSPAVGGFHTRPNPALGAGMQYGQQIQAPNFPLRRPMPFPGLQGQMPPNMQIGNPPGLLGR